MRRPSSVELMLLTVILLWALNLSVTKYILEHGLEPLSYATARYALAGAIFVALTLVAERTLRIERRHASVLLVAALLLWLNQVCFVLALDATTASTIGLLIGTIPIFAALFGVALGRERLSARFWAAGAISSVGVALVAIGSAGHVEGGYGGILLGLVTAATWAAYSVAVTPLMQTYSPSHVSAVVIGGAWVLIALVGLPVTTSQDWDVGWEIWTLLVLATLGPLVLTNILWFRVLHRIGPARATLAANLQPFVAAVLAVILLSETLGLAQIAGGVLIAVGIVVARRRTAPAQAA
jgi:drug/metabolite transporter (DMT)-like permease